MLKAAPWVIRDGSDVLAKVSAVNSVGEARSESGNGATFIVPCEDNKAPDAPVDLEVNSAAARSITFTWTDPKCDGGSEIQAY